MISFACPKCGAEMGSPDSLAGETERCPDCGSVTTVPRPQAPEPDPLEALSRALPTPSGPKPSRRGPKTGQPAKPSKKQCPKCKEWIDKGATKCPHCRSTQPPPAWVTAIAVAVVLGGGIWAYRSCSSITDSPEARKAAAREQRHGSKGMAWIMAQDFVKKRLVSPGSADFGGMFEQSYEDCVTDLGQGQYTVNGWVDSQNRFGAKLRSHFTCRLRYVGNDKWQCESLDISER